jgi:hypothetical protein
MMPDWSAWRDRFSAVLREDLTLRLGPACPIEREFLHRAADLAACLSQLDATIRAAGVDDRFARMHAKMTTSLLRGLRALGTDRVAGSLIEEVLATSICTADACLALVPVAGCA